MSPSALPPSPPSSSTFPHPPRILIIGAGSRGTAYAKASLSSTNATITSICEPLAFKRLAFGRRFIWGANATPQEGQAFEGWREWVEWEKRRRSAAVANGDGDGSGVSMEMGVTAVFVCVLDEMHEEVVCGIAAAGLGVHVCCEKPMSTRLESCVRMARALGAAGWDADGRERGVLGKKETVFGICHVLRYSPHNMLLRRLLLEDRVIGDVLSIEHVEPVGWWHFSHSYVRYGYSCTHLERDTDSM